jgi:crotonobetainyl-CoA:carnitine CoA-transferase CaiB-like acyl-CoA transferase
VTVDLASSAGQALIRRMAEQCDVFVENYKVGDMARLRPRRRVVARHQSAPRLLLGDRIRADRPVSRAAGYDYAIQGMGGLMSVTGPGRHEIADDAPGGGPQKVGVAVADLFTGLYATTAILAALRHRDRTGQGQAIDMALLDSQVAMLANLGAGYLTTGVAPAASRQCAPEHRAVPGLRRSPTATSSWRWATMASTRAFCRVAGRPDLATDPALRPQCRPGAQPVDPGPAAGGRDEAPTAPGLAQRPRAGQGSMRSDQRPRRRSSPIRTCRRAR